MLSDTVVCEEQSASYVHILFAENIALRHHLRTYYISFAESKGHSYTESWRILCFRTEDCSNIAPTLEGMMNAKLTDLEISFMLIEIHNAVARFLNILKLALDANNVNNQDQRKLHLFHCRSLINPIRVRHSRNSIKGSRRCHYAIIQRV